jgi:hypothetical protein
MQEHFMRPAPEKFWKCPYSSEICYFCHSCNLIMIVFHVLVHAASPMLISAPHCEQSMMLNSMFLFQFSVTCDKSIATPAVKQCLESRVDHD